MSKIKVKVIDILDDKYAIVKKSDGLCKLLETNEESRLKINQTYLFIKSTEDKDIILQGNIKPIKIADIVITDLKKDNKEIIRKLFNTKRQLTSKDGVSGCIKSFANENNNKDINSTDLKITGKLVRVLEKDGQYGKFFILYVKDVENQKIIVMVYYNKNFDFKIEEVVNISKLKYTNKQKENMNTIDKFVQTTFNSKITKVEGMSKELFKNIPLGDITKEAKFSGITQSKIYFSCEYCLSKCSEEEPENPIICVKCEKSTNTKTDHYVEIVLEDNDDIIYLVIFKRYWDIKEICEFKPKKSEDFEQFIINICDGKHIVFHANYDEKDNCGNKFIAVKVNLK